MKVSQWTSSTQQNNLEEKKKKKFRATGSTLDSTRNMQRHTLTMKQDRHCTYNVTMKCVHATTVAVEKQ